MRRGRGPAGEAVHEIWVVAAGGESTPGEGEEVGG